MPPALAIVLPTSAVLTAPRPLPKPAALEIFSWLFPSEVCYSRVTIFYKLLIVFRGEKKCNCKAELASSLFGRQPGHSIEVQRFTKFRPCPTPLLPIATATRGCARKAGSDGQRGRKGKGAAQDQPPHGPSVSQSLPKSHRSEEKRSVCVCVGGERPELLTLGADTQPEQRAAIKVSV